MSFLPFFRRWFGTKTPAIQSQSTKPEPDTELLDRAEVLLEDLNDFQDNVARSLDSIPGSFLTAGGSRTDANVEVLTGGGNADGLHSHASMAPVLSNTPPPPVALASSAGVAAQAARADHTHGAPPVRGAVLMWGNSGWGAGTATKYADPFWIASAAGTNPIQIRAARPGTLRNLMLQARVVGTGTFAARVRVNDVATPLAVTVAGVAQAENTTNQVAINLGDRIDLEIVRTVAGSPTDITITVELV